MSTSIIKKLFTRREFIQSSAAASGVAVAASSISLPFNALAAKSESSPSEEQIRYSACLVNCGSRCPFKVHVRDGVAVKISPEDGVNEAIFGQHQIRPCLRGRSARFRTYNPDRLKYPMKRIGARGEGKFKRISWDEATTIVANELKRVISTYGNEAIYYQYGSGTTGANLQGRNTCKRLLNLAGGFLDMHNTYSEAQLNRIQPFVFGQAGNIYGTEQQTLFSEIRHSDLVVMFGQNLAETRMSGGGQIAEIYHALEQSGARVILIDPRRTDSVTAFNAEWLPIRPGTDAALVAAIGHTLIKENLLDEAMLNQYTVGWSEETLPASAPANASYKSYILGLGEDKTEKTPEWAEALTEIPAQRIRELAREIAGAKAAWISQGWGVQRTQNGEHASRAIMMLPIMTGQFGRPGTNIGTWGGSVNYPLAGLAIANPVKVSIPCFSWLDAITRGTEMTAKKDYVKGRDRLATNVKFLWNYASNMTGNQHSNLNQVDKVLRDESLCEFILVWDNHMTATAKYADLLLPDVSTLESDELINNSYQSGSYHYLVRLQKAIEPMWENRPTYDVLAEIAEKMGIKEAFTEGRTYQEWIEFAYNQVRKQEPHLPPFSETDGMGVIDRRVADSSKHIALKEFRDNPQLHPLKTPSGKIEIYSESLAELATQWELLPGDKISPIPEYWPAVEGIEDKAQLSKYPLQMTGFHTKGHCHSTYSSVAQLKEAAPDVLWMNPIDAQARGIKTDDFVEVFNDRGRLRIKAKVSPRIMPGVTAMPEGAWAKTNKEGVDVGGCINRLTSLRPTALAKGNPQHTNLVDVKRI
ncbi:MULTISPECIES: DMSO/selenate family reductase complex A subunit [unclassified Vibrio]|uniref:DMSO/selenate family reductase complex A subunit n=3 Tax=Vibrio TaxID=662 RepID=UPI001372BF17|nr:MULTISPECIES: DMSO/selenate family reductase complex A subunit [unclassified Vibrio]NAW69975.1 molybdopterin-dependent oxidoreductase [Vibrio sp. V28_P6S34P95]NAX03708.1 molybdopterin-dependent oxidoreductase [Vibrio sp. V30_P3S12P165]NAX35063.1 molybdopterin-dependent oxidoreductase [Vibrio sp. V29_P1S30P107]NAX36324.1 molybdopterin-dependent oxidoreductase [Vibrio sp. V27_P1S3P104]NAX41316.1 molybdopterin-dependent oxidoreductase [Vibrio sp. V26_P1S5P106]